LADLVAIGIKRDDLAIFTNIGDQLKV